MLLLIVPLAVAEPLKLIALLVAGEGHWLGGTVIIVAAYSASILVVERLFRVVKPKLLMLNWFATGWDIMTKLRSLVASWLGLNRHPMDKVRL